MHIWLLVSRRLDLFYYYLENSSGIGEPIFFIFNLNCPFSIWRDLQLDSKTTWKVWRYEEFIRISSFFSFISPYFYIFRLLSCNPMEGWLQCTRSMVQGLSFRVLQVVLLVMRWQRQARKWETIEGLFKGIQVVIFHSLLEEKTCDWVRHGRNVDRRQPICWHFWPCFWNNYCRGYNPSTPAGHKHCGCRWWIDAIFQVNAGFLKMNNEELPSEEHPPYPHVSDLDSLLLVRTQQGPIQVLFAIAKGVPLLSLMQICC